MKRWIAALCAFLLMPTMAAAQDGLVSIAELREQVKESPNSAMQESVYVPSVEKLPILSVRLKEVEKTGQGELPGYPSVERMDYEKYGLNTRERIGTSAEISYQNLIFQAKRNDLTQVFASNQPDSAEAIMKKGAQAIQGLNPQNEEGLLPHMLMIQSPWKYADQPGSMGKDFECGELTGLGGYYVSYYPVLQGIPIIGGIGMGFEEGAPGSRELRRILSERSEYTYGYYLEDFWLISGLGIWEQVDIITDNMLLCPLEKVVQTLEKHMADGTIEEVHTVILGYVVYMDREENYTEKPRYAAYTAVPTWCVSVHYRGRFKEHEWMFIDARTGEAYDHQAKNISDWYAPAEGQE